MTARVLVVDDIPTNTKLLEARLSAEYFEVHTALSGQAALDICANTEIDIILLDVMMPDMDGFEVCERLKADPATHHIPVVMVTALDQASDRVRGLEAGADDFLTKPPDDMQLMARVKSLVRLKMLTDELRARAHTGQQIAAEDAEHALATISPDNGRILVVDDDPERAERVKKNLAPEHYVEVVADPTSVAMNIADRDFEVALISMGLSDFDPLRVSSQLRTLEQTRNLPIILMAEEKDRAAVMRGLDLGVNDFIMRPIERNELTARVRTQVRRRRHASELRQSVHNTMAMAVVDQLTGLYNRRYFDRHLAIMLDRAAAQDRALGVMMLDIDHFKMINDNHGHDVGDRILKDFANRMQRNIRGVDLACRYGGEEFVVLMPDTDRGQVQRAAERIRDAMADTPFNVSGELSLRVTISAGVALNESIADTPEAILKRADMALYRAKQAGRNRVTFDAA